LRDKFAMKTFTFIDLFAGIGGFRLALDALGGSCVFTSEIDEKAQETYIRNHGGEVFGDIRQITSPKFNDTFVRLMIPDHDVLAAGFPCQPFSLAGVSARNALGRVHGLLDETQGTLFYDIARIIKVKTPKVVLLENVSNIVNHDEGRTFDTIRRVFRELGYTVHSDVLNAETLVPQRRRRCFIVAFREAVELFNFPELTGEPLHLRSALEKNVDPSFTISDKGWAGHKRRTKTNLARGAGFTAYEADLDRPSNTIVARYYKDGKECLIPQKGANPRMLTPRECARLQGFPETFIPHPSKSSAYKQFGNAVPVPLVKAVAESMLEALWEYESGQADTAAALKKHGSDTRQEHKARTRRKKVPA
jgi:DNA (cytosine-5)-methyltransferase 1